MVKIKTECELGVDEIAAALTPLELMAVFNAAANRLIEANVSYEQRRAFARAFSDTMSERGKALLAEIFSIEYIKSQHVPEFP